MRKLINTMKGLTVLVLFLILVCFSSVWSINLKCEDRFKDSLKSEYYQHMKRKENILFLLDWPDNKELSNYNNKFIHIAYRLGFEVRKVEQFCPDDELRATAIAAAILKNVINLRVINAFHYSEEDILYKNLVFVGHSEEFEEEINLCSFKEGGDRTIFDEISHSTTTKHTTNSIEFVDRTKKTTKVSKSPVDLQNTSDEMYDNETQTYILNENAKDGSTECKLKTEKIFAPKLVSTSITKYRLLFKVITGLTKNSTERNWKNYFKISNASKPFTKFSVLICASKNTKKVLVKTFKNYTNKAFDKIVFRYVENCKKINDYSLHYVFAALAPEPLEQEELTLIPVIFYDIPYLLKEHINKYPNSMTVFDQYFANVKDVLMKFIESRGWNRIAVVSDDSTYSDSFESDLTAMFQQNKVVYTVKQCSKKVCDFREALIYLRNAEARIIIANVGDKYAMKLAETATSFNITSRQGFIWIWRNWPVQGDQVINTMSDVFSLYLAPSSQENQKMNNVDHRFYLYNIIKGIDAVQTAKGTKTIKELETEIEKGQTQFYRKLSTKIRRALKTDSVQVHLKRISASDSQNKVIFNCSISSASGKIIKCEKEAMNLPEDLKGCVIRSYDFNRPCDDVHLLLFMLVLLLFMLTIIAVYTFFTEYSLRIYTSL